MGDQLRSARNALLGALLILAGEPAVLAAAMDEIVVTVQRREQTLLEVPSAVTAIGSGEIEARGIRDFSSYLTTVPGANFQDTTGVGGEIKFRGIGTGQNAQLSPTAAVYFGDVPVIHTGRNVNASYNFWLADLERIEVLRGPQGQLYGANSLSGAIKYVPAPVNLDGFELRAAFGGAGTEGGSESYNGDLTLNLPLVDGVFGLRVTGYAVREGGWYDNKYPGGQPLQEIAAFAPPVLDLGPGGLAALPGSLLPATIAILTPPGPPTPDGPGVLGLQPAAASYAAPPVSVTEDTNEQDIVGARAILSWQMTSRLSADLMLAIEDRETDGAAFAEYPNPLVFGGPMGLPLANTPGIPLSFPPPIELENYEHFQTTTANMEDEITLINLLVNYDFDFATLTSSTSYWDRTEELNLSLGITAFQITGVPNTVPLTSFRTDNPEVITQEFRLTSTSDGPVDWLAGLFWQEIDQDHRVLGVDQSGLDLRYFTEVARANLIGFPPPATTTLADNQANFVDEQFAVFGQLGYRFTDQWRAAFSFRWFTLDQDFRSVSSGFQFGLAQGEQSGSNSEDVFTPRFELSWQPDEDMLWYLAAAEGFRTGIINRDIPQSDCGAELAAAGYPNGLPPTDADTLWNYELGTKLSLFEQRLQLNGAVYYIDWSDLQLNFPLSAFAPGPFSLCAYDGVANAGDASSVGVELELSAALTDSLRLDWAFSYTDAEFDDEIPQLRIEKGTTIPFTTEFSSFLSLNYDFTLAARDGFGRIEWQYLGDKEPLTLDFPAAQYPDGVPFDIGDYHQLNLRAGVDLTDSLSAELWITNLTDEFGVTSVSTTGGLGYPLVSTIRPRMFGGTLRMRF